LLQGNGEQNGTIEFAARWQLAYKSPPGVHREEPLNEDEAKELIQVAAKPPRTPKKYFFNF